MIGDPNLPRDISAYPRLITRLYELFRKFDLTLDQNSSEFTTLVASVAAIDTRVDALEAIKWDDLRFPAQGINPAGTATPPTVDVTTYFGTLLFSSTTNNVVAGVAQMPHAWKEGTAVKPHIHWTKTTADGTAQAVAWQFQYIVAGIGDAIGAYSSVVNGTLATGDLTTLEKHNVSTFGDIDMTGKLISTMIIWRLQRDVGSDAYGADARLLEVDFHYQVDSNGSLLEFDKTP